MNINWKREKIIGKFTVIKNSEKNEEQNKKSKEKEEDDFHDNKIMESFNFPNLNMNNMKSISEI